MFTVALNRIHPMHKSEDFISQLWKISTNVTIQQGLFEMWYTSNRLHAERKFLFLNCIIENDGGSGYPTKLDHI